MATKKPQEAAEDAVKEEAKAEEAPKSAWDEEMTIYVPRKAKGDDQSWMLMVNDRLLYVPANGKMQTLPRPFAEVLQAAVEAETRAEEYSEMVTRKAMEASKYIQ